jgi:hypothetical protein
VQAASGRLLFSAGDIFEALVLENQGDGKVTLQVKNTSISAEARVTLNAGEKITVRVDQTAPTIVLRLIGSTATEKIGELLCLQRSHAGSLSELFSAARTFIDPAVIESHAGQNAAKSAQSLLQLLDLSVFSGNTAPDSLFLKDMMTLLGLSLERNLLKEQQKQERTETVKELLLRLAGDIRDAGAAERLQTTMAFLERGTKAIESQQIAALLGQELDHSLVLQAACQFPTGIRLQDIFIEQKSDGPQGLKQFRAVLFLSMDSLGDIIADASSYGKHLDCSLYCPTPQILGFINDLLPELRERLIAAGYPEPGLRCALERHTQIAKNDFMKARRLYSQQAVDIKT